jgi:hypothetical protein
MTKINAPPSLDAASKKVAQEIRNAAAHNDASRTVANYLAPKITVRSFSSPELSGDFAGPIFRHKMIDALSAAANAIKNFEMREIVEIETDKVTISTFKGGQSRRGERFDDHSIATYTLVEGQVVSSESAHMNTGGLINLLKGDSSLADADAMKAQEIGQSMRALKGRPCIKVIEPYLTEKVAMFFPRTPERNLLAERQLLKDASVNEPAAYNKALDNWSLTEEIDVRGNAIAIRGHWTGTLKSDNSPLWGDEDIILYIVNGRVAAWCNDHAPEAMANTLKALSAGGFDMESLPNAD